MAKITVGIPAFRTTFLVEAVSSVLSQTHTDFELLVSDDSPDGSVSELLLRFRDPRIRLIEGPRQGLVANSMNIWEKAETDLLKYLHDDDTLFPQALEVLSGLLEKDPRFVFAASRRVVIDEYGRELRRPVTYLTDGWLWYEQAQLANYLVRTLSNPLGGPSNLLIRRSAFDGASCLGRFAGLPIARLPDVALMFNSTLRGPTVATGEYLSAFREHRGQFSTQIKATDHALSLLEWEVCLRGAVALGLAAPHSALDGVSKLATAYGRLAGARPEVYPFLHMLPSLQEQLGTGSRDVLTPQFEAGFQRALAAIAKRAAAAPCAPATEDAQDGPQTSEPRIRAQVDQVSARGARGWAWTPDAPEQRVHAEAVAGDRVLGHALCNVSRPDLVAWNVGATDYGFEMAFYEPHVGDEPVKFRFFTDAEEYKAAFQVSATGVPRERAEAALREHARFTAPGPDFELFAPPPGGPARRLGGPAPLLAAFYLPQFHPIPENDRNWGEGFTEWRQLARGIPRFPGHYQPRIPRDLGFYDLLNIDVIRRQCEMAKAAGVGAFAFYYYWFNRKRVLDQPIELFLGSDIEMPFFIIWANENWTRTWDGSEDQVLLKQDYKREDEDALLADLARHMQDPRHVRLQGRPLFVIYNPVRIPETARTLERWRRKWSQVHGLEPLIYMAQAFEHEDPRPYEMDGAMEFPPHKVGNRISPRDVSDAFSNEFAGRVMPYEKLVAASLAEPAPSFPLIKTALPGWDNEARRPNRSLIFEASSPQKYEAWLQALIERAMDAPVHGTPLVAINAWNEWAEGAYLEPDVHFGSAYLNATARALQAAIRKRNAAVEGQDAACAGETIR